MIFCLQNVENILWIVAEDAHEPTKEVQEFLSCLNIQYKYLLGKHGTRAFNFLLIGINFLTTCLAPMPQKYRDLPKGFWPKGVSNRNAALKWIYQHVMSEGGGNSGALYFADDDNTYDIRLFEEVRNVLTCVCL